VFTIAHRRLLDAARSRRRRPAVLLGPERVATVADALRAPGETVPDALEAVAALTSRTTVRTTRCSCACSAPWRRRCALALSLVAGLVTAVTLTLDDRVEFELAMEPGFTPSPVPFDREEEHVILTVDADRAELVTDELARLAGADPAVLSVRTDRTSFTVPDTPMVSFATTKSPVPSWGLDRIDAQDDRLDDSYGFVSTGSGVRVYVIDTGVRSDHSDLAGRVVPGYSAIADGRGSEDCNGHGTHVAGNNGGDAVGHLDGIAARRGDRRAAAAGRAGLRPVRRDRRAHRVRGERGRG